MNDPVVLIPFQDRLRLHLRSGSYASLHQGVNPEVSVPPLSHYSRLRLSFAFPDCDVCSASVYRNPRSLALALAQPKPAIARALALAPKPAIARARARAAQTRDRSLARARGASASASGAVLYSIGVD